MRRAWAAGGQTTLRFVCEEAAPGVIAQGNQKTTGGRQQLSDFRPLQDKTLWTPKTPTRPLTHMSPITADAAILRPI